MQVYAAVVIAVAAVAFALLPAGDAIICYQCKSWEDPACWDIKQNQTNNKYAKFCDSDEIPQGVQPFCRTIRQKIRDGNGTERLWRKCGWEEHKTKTGERYPKPCYYYSDGHHEESVCQCFFDLCNAASARSASPVAVLAAVAAASFLALRVAS
ncbi:Lymphocyte antigen 6 complex locus protein G6d [Frankliniella fusca]|uniref:Lymphocyte antigen 6 complex locus protein G6d n=1 Tax=Frankliniella fusca TaxID=407009 RepID=A0AAE1HK50_9NEOP|nr:Lymphocyte antigen 6 complex locus protein G6d [Frankliniella fusca]